MNPGMWTWLGWFVFGIVIGVGTTVLWYAVKDKTSLRWFEWLLGALTILLVGFTLQTFFASFAENEPTAGWMSLIFLGFPAIVLAVITTRSVQARI
mgnify:CR=1 FL=1